jgi:signal transduction histidine kinase
MLRGSVLLEVQGSAASTGEVRNQPGHADVLRRGLGLILREPHVRKVFAFCVFGTAFYFAYRYGMSFSQASASPFWFPDSVLLCALLLSRPRYWGVFALGALPIRLFSEVARDIPLWFLLATFAIDSARAVLTAAVLRRVIKSPIRFETLREVALFFVWAVFLIPAAAALGGAAARQALGHEFWPAWEQWFLGNALAHLVVTPALLFWIFGAPLKAPAPSARRWVEGGLIAVGLIATGYLAFSTPAESAFTEPRFYAPVPFLFWAAVRFGMLGASGAIAVIAFLSVEAALGGRGPFAGRSPADTALTLQHFLLLRAVPLYLVAVLVEQRRGAEQSLRESQERMHLAAIAGDACLWDWDIVQDQVWFADPARTSVELGEMASLDFAGLVQLVHPEDREDVSRALRKAVDGGGAYESKHRIVLPSGQVRWFVSVGRVEFDAARRPIRLRGASRDVTRSQQVDQQLERQREELAQLARAAVLGELSGSLAHELDQPLTAILINAQAAERLLAQGCTDPSDVREILGDIVADDRRAGEIIRRLRQLFRRGEIQRQQVHLNDLVREVSKLVRSDLLSRGMELSMALAADLPPVSGDSVQLQQVLLNLINNACAAMADVAAARLVVRTAFCEGEGVGMSVSDSGRGIPVEDLARVFEPFFTTRPQGMGLGLAVCRTIISAHHGRLWAENNSDRGASFHVVLPVAEEHPA